MGWWESRGKSVLARELHRRVRRAVDGLGLSPVPTGPLHSFSRRVALRVLDADGRGYVAKGAWRGGLSHEVTVHRWAHDAGVPVPSLVEFVDGNPAVMILEDLGGSALSGTERSGAWPAAGEVLRRLHGTLPAPWFDDPGDDRGPWLDGLRAEITEAVERRRIAVGLAEAVEEVLADAAPWVTEPDAPRTLVHGDCMPKHMIFDGRGELRLIDLEHARIGDPALDLAVLTAFAPQRLEQVLEGYRAAPSEEARLRRIVPARQVERLVRAVNWTARHDFGHAHALAGLEESVARFRDRPTTG